MNTLRPGFGVPDIMALRAEALSRQTALREVRSASVAQPRDASATPAAGFAATLDNAMQQVSAVQNRSSELQVAYERGEVTDIAQVMIARQEAGIAFEAALQTRNKLLSAYQDIMRMGG